MKYRRILLMLFLTTFLFSFFACSNFDSEVYNKTIEAKKNNSSKQYTTSSEPKNNNPAT